MISTRGRYALRVMVDLAEHATGAFTPLKGGGRAAGYLPEVSGIHHVQPVQIWFFVEGGSGERAAATAL